MKANYNFFGINIDYNDADIILFSASFDGTASYRPGSRFAGQAIRAQSLMGFETYSPYQDRDLSEIKFCDIGEIEIDFNGPEAAIKKTYEVTKEILGQNKMPFMIGGEHSLSIGSIKACHEVYPNLKVIQLDAHTDLRDEYLGSKFSHASAMRRVHDLLSDKKIYQYGIRSGEKNEFLFAEKHNHLFKYNLKEINFAVKQNIKEPVYLTIDLDVLDPSVLPGTGTPEPGGITFNELIIGLLELSKLKNIVGIDVVELAPEIDPTGVSTAAAIKVIRECLLLKGA